MKKNIILFLCLIFGGISISAQKKLQAYFGLNTSSAVAFGKPKIETTEYTGIHADRKTIKASGFSRKKMPLSFGLQAEAGIVIKERLMIGTGIRYLFRQQEGIIYCHVCDLWITETTDFSSYYFEIPLRIQLNLMEEKNTFPVVSAELYWSKANGIDEVDFITGEVENLNFLGYKFGVGVARKIGKHQLTIESQFNKSLVDKTEYPNYYLQEIQLNLRWTFSLF